MIKKGFLAFSFCLFSAFASAQVVSQKHQVTIDYIKKYKKIAIKKMEEHHIPASITLAQAILESGSGESELTKKSNNHFGIKCHDWKGEKVYHDDDIKDDCFRKYERAEDSFEDHSLFLMRPRYASLYKLPIDDYKAWAKELKSCGYATDPNYANRLINLIETYELYQYDKAADIPNNDSLVDGNASDGDDASKEEMKNVEDNYLCESKMGVISARSRHTVKRVDGCRAVIANEGDTYASIAKEFGLRKWQIRRYNNVKKKDNQAVEHGQTVYLQRKK